MPYKNIILRQPFLVVMPVWNRSYFTRVSVNSVMKFGPFNLVYDLIVFDNYSTEFDSIFFQANLITVVTGAFPNANYCLNEIKNFIIPDFIRFIVKIDNDIEIQPNFFQTLLKTFNDFPKCGTIFFAKHGDRSFSSVSSEHGGVFATRRNLFDQYDRFALSGKYPGCQGYHKFVLSNNYGLFSCPGIAIDLSESMPDLSKEYISKGWQRDIYGVCSIINS